MKLKNEKVNIKNLNENMIIVIGIMEKIAKEVISYDYELTITSGNDSIHMINSLHYANRAIDIRIRDMKKNQTLIIIQKLKECLKTLYKKNKYDIILEKNHIHIELNY